jgi:predicted MFS family arabinose efflux permease
VKPLNLFVAISSTNHFVFAGTRLAVVLYAVQLGASPALVGVLAALFGLVAAFASVPAGRLMDRIGPAQPMLWCSILMGAGAGLGFVWPKLASLFWVSSLVGTFYSLFFIGQTQWLGRLSAPADRLRDFSFSSLGLSAGALLGPLATGFMIDRTGHASAFLMLGLATLFPISVIALRTIEHPPGRAAANPGAKREKQSVMDLLRDPRIRRIYGVSVLANATWSIFGLLMPIYGAQVGLSASSIGLILAAYAVASFVIRAAMTLLQQRFSSWQLMIGSLAITGACFVALPLFSGVAPLMAIAFFIGLGMGLSGPLSQALLYEASPSDRIGEVMGLRVTAMNTTQTVMPLASGAVTAALGTAPVFWALAALLIGGGYLVRAQWTRGRAEPMKR